MSRPGSTPSTTIGNVHEGKPPKKCWQKCFKCVGNWMKYQDKGEWLKDMRGNLSLVATVIATMSFQFAINPPGGVVQLSANDNFDCSNSSNPCPGEAVFGAVNPDGYFRFLLCNTICFVASMIVCLLLVSGLPLNYRFPMWLLSLTMCVALTCLSLTYLFGASMVTPNPIWGSALNVFTCVLLIWIGLLIIIGLLLTIRFLVWVVKKCIKCMRQRWQQTPRNDNEIPVGRA